MKKKRILWAGISLSITFALLSSFKMKTRQEEKDFVCSKVFFQQTGGGNYVVNPFSSPRLMVFPRKSVNIQGVDQGDCAHPQTQYLLAGVGPLYRSFMNIIEDYKIDQLDVRK